MWAFTWPHTTEHCVYLLSESDETAAVSLWLCLTIYIIAASQHPHRRELKPGITDDITTLLNETTGPCVREGFTAKWDYTTRLRCGLIFSDAGLLYPNMTTQTGLLRSCGLTKLFLFCFKMNLIYPLLGHMH